MIPQYRSHDERAWNESATRERAYEGAPNKREWSSESAPSIETQLFYELQHFHIWLSCAINLFDVIARCFSNWREKRKCLTNKSIQLFIRDNYPLINLSFHPETGGEKRELKFSIILSIILQIILFSSTLLNLLCRIISNLSYF